jgi:Domain of unknown function (DUF4394)
VADASLSIPPDVPVATGVTGAAYTNNDNDGHRHHAVRARHEPRPGGDPVAPNAGLLAPTGLLGVKPKGDAGFDIHYASRSKGAYRYGLAALQVRGAQKLYRIDLLAGEADRIGAFPDNRQVTDLTAGFNRDDVEGIIFDPCPYHC